MQVNKKKLIEKHDGWQDTGRRKIKDDKPVKPLSIVLVETLEIQSVLLPYFFEIVMIYCLKLGDM